jgi:hypothetical protein
MHDVFVSMPRFRIVSCLNLPSSPIYQVNALTVTIRVPPFLLLITPHKTTRYMATMSLCLPWQMKEHGQEGLEAASRRIVHRSCEDPSLSDPRCHHPCSGRHSPGVALSHQCYPEMTPSLVACGHPLVPLITGFITRTSSLLSAPGGRHFPERVKLGSALAPRTVWPRPVAA